MDSNQTETAIEVDLPTRKPLLFPAMISPSKNFSSSIVGGGSSSLPVIGIEVEVDKKNKFDLSPLEDHGVSPTSMKSPHKHYLSSLKKSSTSSTKKCKHFSSKKKKSKHTSRAQKSFYSPSAVRRHLGDDFNSTTTPECCPNENLRVIQADGQNSPCKNDEETIYHDAQTMDSQVSNTGINKQGLASRSKSRNSLLSNNSPSQKKMDLINNETLISRKNDQLKKRSSEAYVDPENMISVSRNCQQDTEDPSLASSDNVALDEYQQSENADQKQAPHSHSNGTDSTDSLSSNNCSEQESENYKKPHWEEEQKSMKHPTVMSTRTSSYASSSPSSYESPPVLMEKKNSTAIWTHVQNLFVRKLNICAPDALSVGSESYGGDNLYRYPNNPQQQGVISKLQDIFDPSARPRSNTSTSSSLSGKENDQDTYNLGHQKKDSDANSHPVKVAIINEARGKIKLAQMSMHPALLDQSMYRGFDGKRSHYNVLDPIASASIDNISNLTMDDDSVKKASYPQTSIRKKLAEYNKQTGDFYWRNAVKNPEREKGEKDTNFDANETEAILHVKSKRKETDGYKIMDSGNHPSTDEHVMTNNERNLIHDFLNYSTSEDDEYSISASDDTSWKKSMTRSSNHKTKLNVIGENNEQQRVDSKSTSHHHRVPTLCSINTRSTTASKHRRSNSDFTFTNDMLTNICDERKNRSNSKLTRASVTPPRINGHSVHNTNAPILRCAHNETTIKKANRPIKLYTPPISSKKTLSTRASTTPNRNVKAEKSLIKDAHKFESVRRLHIPRSPPETTKLPVRTSEKLENMDLTEYQKGSFLPKCSQFKQWLKSKKLDDNCIFEGWVGFYDGKEKGVLQRLKANKLFRREDIRYAILLMIGKYLTMQVFSSPESSKNTNDNVSIQKLDLASMRTTVNIVFVSKRKGSCLEIKRENERLCYLIPVNLPRLFYVNDMRSRLVSEKMFEKIQRRIVKESHGNPEKISYKLKEKSELSLEWGDPSYMLRYAPERQNDAVLHLMFILNSAIKKRNDDLMEPVINKMIGDLFQ